MEKREIVENWLSDLCYQLDETIDNADNWSQAFISQVQAATDRDLIETINGFSWYTPDDSDVDYLYPIACVAK